MGVILVAGPTGRSGCRMVNCLVDNVLVAVASSIKKELGYQEFSHFAGSIPIKP